MNDFDNQVNAAFYGAGKPLTPDVIAFMDTFNRVMADTVYSCPVAWQENERIVANIRQAQADGGNIEGLYSCAVGDDYEAAIRRMIEFFENPPRTYQARVPRA